MSLFAWDNTFFHWFSNSSLVITRDFRIILNLERLTQLVRNKKTSKTILHAEINNHCMYQNSGKNMLLKNYLAGLLGDA